MLTDEDAEQEDMVKFSRHRVQEVTICYNDIDILPANLFYDVINGKAA